MKEIDPMQTECIKAHFKISDPLEEAESFNEILCNYKALAEKVGNFDKQTISIDISTLHIWRNLMLLTANENCRNDFEKLEKISKLMAKYGIETGKTEPKTIINGGYFTDY